MKIAAFIITALSCQLHADSIRCITRLGSMFSTEIRYLDLDQNREISRVTAPGQYYYQAGLRLRGREIVLATDGEPGSSPVSRFVTVNLDTGAVAELGTAPVTSSHLAARNSFAVVADKDFWLADETGVRSVMTSAEYNQLISPKVCERPDSITCDDQRIYFIGMVQPSTGRWPWGLFSFTTGGEDLQFHELIPPPDISFFGTYVQAMCVAGGQLYFCTGNNIYQTGLQGGEVTRIYSAGTNITSLDFHAGRLYFTDSRGVSSVLPTGSSYRLHFAGATGSLDVFTEGSTAPSISMEDYTISYTGLLESSEDLIGWSLVTPQPPATFDITADAPRRFYRATDFQNQ